MKTNTIDALVRLTRPVQWLKNSFVFVGFLFSEQYSDLYLLYRVSLTTMAFCFVASSIYVLNDIVDCEQDRKHPDKKDRPLPRGNVSISSACVLSAILGACGLGLGWWVSFNVLGILFMYVVLNIFYSYWWKHVVIVDVFCVSAGFMLRILAGTVGVDITPSVWLLFCGMMITLFLGFAKRRAEIIALTKHKEEHRKVLGVYELTFLDEVIAICATGVIIAYSLYTMSSTTIEVHNTENLIYTVPFVMYGLFRYLFLLHHCHLGGDPTKDLIQDPHIIGVVVSWAAITGCIFYFY